MSTHHGFRMFWGLCPFRVQGIKADDVSVISNTELKSSEASCAHVFHSSSLDMLWMDKIHDPIYPNPRNLALRGVTVFFYRVMQDFAHQHHRKGFRCIELFSGLPRLVQGSPH